MSEEIFDIVNDHDEVIGRLPRSKVHRDGLKHRATHVLVFNSRGDVFLQKRSWKKDNSPGVWDSSASGHVDSGEEYDPCAVRELREELGLTRFRAAGAACSKSRPALKRARNSSGRIALNRKGRSFCTRRKLMSADGSRQIMSMNGSRTARRISPAGSSWFGKNSRGSSDF